MGKSIKFKDKSGYVYPYPYWPVGSIYLSVNSTNPTNYFGGTWVQIAQGRTLIGQGSNAANTTNYWGTYNAGANAFPNGEMGGEPCHTLTTSEMPKHSHNMYPIGSGSGGTLFPPLGAWNGSVGSLNAFTNEVGGGAAHNNMPPYLVVYIWKRTA